MALAPGKSSPTFDLGTIGNVISGRVGGGVLGQIVTLLLPSIMAAAQSHNLQYWRHYFTGNLRRCGGAILTGLILRRRGWQNVCSVAIARLRVLIQPTPTPTLPFLK